jgi:hypothetical protein
MLEKLGLVGALGIIAETKLIEVLHNIFSLKE